MSEKKTDLASDLATLQREAVLANTGDNVTVHGVNLKMDISNLATAWKVRTKAKIDANVRYWLKAKRAAEADLAARGEEFAAAARPLGPDAKHLADADAAVAAVRAFHPAAALAVRLDETGKPAPAHETEVHAATDEYTVRLVLDVGQGGARVPLARRYQFPAALAAARRAVEAAAAELQAAADRLGALAGERARLDEYKEMFEASVIETSLAQVDQGGQLARALKQTEDRIEERLDLLTDAQMAALPARKV